MRTSFINQLIEEASINENIFLLVGDLGFSVVEPFAELFPDRFLNIGIAEQNMVGVAAGLAKEGYTVFTYSIGNFSTLRCLEQIRNDVCYHNLDVKIIAVGAGFSYGPQGVSHHATEDIGIMRTIPNITICSPSDPLETALLTTFVANNHTPCYLRLGKAGEAVVFDSSNQIKATGINQVIAGKDLAVLSTGSITKYAKDFIIENSKDWSLYTIPVLKPFDNTQLIEIVKNYKKIVTLEEHQKSCGFGSFLLEQINDLKSAKHIDSFPDLQRIAIQDEFIYYSGNQSYMRNQTHLNLNNI